MANRFWVGGTATINATAGTKWATTSGGGGGAAVPTAADDVFFDANDGAAGVAVVTISALTARSINCTGFTGTLSHSASVTISIGDATAGASNVALKLVAGMTYTLGSASTSALSFVSTSATQQTITTGGKTLGASQTFSGAGSSYLLADAHTAGTGAGGGNVTLTAGTLNTGGQTCVWAGFSTSGSTARTLTLGASAISVLSTNGWAMVSTSLTMTANTAVVTCAVTGVTITISNGFNTNGLSLVFSGAGAQFLSGGPTLASLTRTGTAAKTDTLSFNGSPTLTGTLALNGNSATNRILVFGATLGTAAIITAAAVSLTNVDFMDITGAGAASPFTGTSIGDCQGNSGITFTTPATQTATVATAKNWSDVTIWTSRVPLPQDDVLLSGVNNTLTLDMPRLGKNIDWTGAGASALWNGNLAWSLFGSLTLVSAVTTNIGGGSISFRGRGSHTIASAGRSFQAANLNMLAPGGTYTLSDALLTTGQFVHSNGTFNSAGFSVTVRDMSTAAGTTLTMGSSVWTLSVTSQVSTIWGIGGTLSAASSTIVIATAHTGSRTFGGQGQSYGTITYTVANSPGALVITGANTIGTLNVGSGRTVTFPSSTVTTVTNWNVSGVNNGYLYLPGLTGHYVSTPDSAALSITGDIDIMARVAPTTWSSGNQAMACKADSTITSYFFQLSSLGALVLRTTVDGTTPRDAVSSVVTGFGADVAKWVRVTRSAATGTVTFYTAPDASAVPVSWTQLGTTIATTAGAIFDGTQIVEIGSIWTGTTNRFSGAIYRVLVLNGIAGTVVCDVDFTTKAVGSNTFAESSSNAATVTINGATAQVGDGRVAVNSSSAGTAATVAKSGGPAGSDYLVMQDNTITGFPGYAGSHSSLVSNTTGWTAVDYSTPSSADTLSGADAAAIAASLASADASSSTEGSSVQVAITVTADTVGTAEAQALGGAVTATEELAATDAASLALGVSQADTVGLGDLAALLVTADQAETLDAVEVAALAAAVIASDPLEVTDAAAVMLLLAAEDLLAAAESESLSTSIAEEDALAITEAATLLALLAGDDTLVLADDGTPMLLAASADAIGLVDSAAIAVALAQAEAVLAAETAALAAALAQVEAVTGADAGAVLVGVSQADLVALVALVDAVSLAVYAVLNLRLRQRIGTSGPVQRIGTTGPVQRIGTTGPVQRIGVDEGVEVLA